MKIKYILVTGISCFFGIGASHTSAASAASAKSAAALPAFETILKLGC